MKVLPWAVGMGLHTLLCRDSQEEHATFKILPPKQTAGRQGHGLSTVAIKVSFWGVSHAQGTTKQGAVHSKINPDNDVIRKAPSGESSSPDLCGVGAGMWPR